jgi:hypothetical protein
MNTNQNHIMNFVPYTLLKESQILTAQAKDIFGEQIVNAAYMAEQVSGKYVVDIMTKTLSNRDISQYIYDKYENQISIDSKCIVIFFTTGKRVLFTSSEWACIRNVEQFENLE